MFRDIMRQPKTHAAKPEPEREQTINNNKNMSASRKEMSVSRKENWGNNDRDALVYGYYERVDIIEGKFSSSVFSAAKSAAWAEVIQQYLIRF